MKFSSDHIILFQMTGELRHIGACIYHLFMCMNKNECRVTIRACLSRIDILCSASANTQANTHGARAEWGTLRVAE
jgi:hypothetical protein